MTSFKLRTKPTTNWHLQQQEVPSRGFTENLIGKETKLTKCIHLDYSEVEELLSFYLTSPLTSPRRRKRASMQEAAVTVFVQMQTPVFNIGTKCSRGGEFPPERSRLDCVEAAGGGGGGGNHSCCSTHGYCVSSPSLMVLLGGGFLTWTIPASATFPQYEAGGTSQNIWNHWTRCLCFVLWWRNWTQRKSNFHKLLWFF